MSVASGEKLMNTSARSHHAKPMAYNDPMFGSQHVKATELSVTETEEESPNRRKSKMIKHNSETELDLAKIIG